MKEFDEQEIIKEISSICLEDDHENDYGAKYLGDGIFKVKLAQFYIASQLLERFRGAGYILCGICTLNGKYGYKLELNLKWTPQVESKHG